jgi:two-component system sensor histidine kinase AdeS
MNWGLRRWLLTVAGAAALAAVLTLAAYLILLSLAADMHLRANLDEALWRKYDDGVTLSREDIAIIEMHLRPFDQLWVMFAGFVPAFIVAVTIGWLGSVPLLRHLAALRSTAQRVRAADLSARVPEVRPTAREIAGFARDFDALIARAERAERESRASAAALAHELRTPLTVIRGRLQGMMDGVFATQPSELAILMGQVDVLHHLIEDLRFLTLWDAGRMTFRSERIFLDDVIRDALAVHPGLHVNLVRVEIQGDRARLKQAVAALLDNAARHAGGADRVTLWREGPDAVLQVMDRGPGLTEAEARQVFERFFRKNSTDPDGSGLGLSVVRAIALGHNGGVQALARDGGGAVFELRLPVTADPASTNPPWFHNFNKQKLAA